jgi:Tfp pilus assembly protein FimV
MLRLKSPHSVIGSASVLVYEFEKNSWRKTHSIDISNSLKVSPKAPKQHTQKIAIVPKVATQCLLIHEPKETLWSIASRYQDKWNVDVFSAMLAIYKSNLNKFTKQHIGQLIANAELICPTRKVMIMLGKKAKMKAEYHQLNNSSY